ncbi:metalloregulator ArsR/SmtB family transcription factor [Cellulomonas cellasea]|uniref:ArsR/SmtB family transcription factor n=1 Tax=Cellulomonas cellasea TaxID=43670 RepID=UPI0025A334D7|nr:metalloregulator ArsR/SmtB family transcription factor [Cellulomonas cellasea]MDM8084530.1 metalloregulator ArsR/SmtB family transcription factor [Cellulomonas cellasea]
MFSALADPTRRDILTRLADGPRTVGELAGHYPISRPAVSQHLAVLEAAGLLTRTVDAQWRLCAVREEGLDDASQWIARQRADWTARFDTLEEHLRSRRKDQR